MRGPTMLNLVNNTVSLQLHKIHTELACSKLTIQVINLKVGYPLRLEEGVLRMAVSVLGHFSEKLRVGGKSRSQTLSVIWVRYQGIHER